METDVIRRISSSVSMTTAGGIAQRLSRNGRHFAGHADDGETIGPVRGDADIENRVPQIERLRQILLPAANRTGEA